MYNKLKHILKSLIPSVLIKKHEKSIRKIVSFFYSGNKYQCNVCGFNLSGFVELNNDDKLCPRCGSLSRTRRLWSILENRIQDKNLLHFSPLKSLKEKFESSSLSNYVTTDYENEFEASKQLNILSIDEPDNLYDLIICYHILEHIEDDLLAMSELLRILKPNGTCLIQTPFKNGEIYENSEIKTAAGKRKHFGQEDHVRIYSLAGLMDRLTQVGFEVESKVYHEELKNKYGYIPNDIVVFAKKPASFL